MTFYYCIPSKLLSLNESYIYLFFSYFYFLKEVKKKIAIPFVPFIHCLYYILKYGWYRWYVVILQNNNKLLRWACVITQNNGSSLGLVSVFAVLLFDDRNGIEVVYVWYTYSYTQAYINNEYKRNKVFYIIFLSF